MAFPILTNKIQIPHAPGRLVARERVFDKVRTGLEDNVRLMLVRAPVALGKSTQIGLDRSIVCARDVSLAPRVG